MFFASVNLVGQTQTHKPINRAASTTTTPANAQLDALAEVYTEELQATQNSTMHRHASSVAMRISATSSSFSVIQSLAVELEEVEEIKAKREEIRVLKREMDACYRGEVRRYVMAAVALLRGPAIRFRFHGNTELTHRGDGREPSCLEPRAWGSSFCLRFS